MKKQTTVAEFSAVTISDPKTKCVQILLDDSTKRAMQQALYDAYRCAWKSIMPLWCELDRAVVDERPFPEIDIFSLGGAEQTCVYLAGLSQKIDEALWDLGYPRKTISPSYTITGHWLGSPADSYPRQEIEDWIAYSKDRSRPYPWS